MSIRFRNFVLLPLLAIATVVAFLAVAEITARLLMGEELADSCSVKAADGVRFKPGCVSRIKAAEGPMTVMRFNECGYRSDHSCRSKIPGSYRIAVLGTSIAQGFTVRHDETYANRIERSLTQDCRRPVDVQHVHISWPKTPDDPAGPGVTTRAREALDLKPDMALFFVTSWDISNYTEPAKSAPTAATTRPPTASGWKSAAWYHALSSTMTNLRALREESRLVLAMRHLMYRNDQQFLDRYLSKPEESAYLRTPLDAAWEARLAMFERTVAPAGAMFASKGIPFAIVYIPFDPQVILSRETTARKGIDAHIFPRRNAAIAAAHGWQFFDTLPALAADRPQHRNFYRVNGHPNGAGSALIASGILDGLRKSGDLRACEAR